MASSSSIPTIVEKRSKKVTRNIQAYQYKYDLPEEVERTRTTWQTGTPQGNRYFREQVERQLNKEIGQARRGRPCKSTKGSDPFNLLTV